ncbi:ATP-binding protein [Shewanella morhuae]|uniref:ATP-binding protein n=1 Tax=Shewanella morhuae TaxID=365591 RepID=A0ABX5HUF8_9GAMM|nr:ATP-binding protein [Shewanella morhuae]
MTVTRLALPPNTLFLQPQELVFEKIATFIGGNGSGKSTILKSIFDEKLKPGSTLYQDYKVVCFSSGQNESYSERFARYLNSERKDKRALSLDCFYYDKSLAKLLIFLSTTSNPNGLVRNFLKQNNYVVENEFEEDETTKISFKVKVDKAYIGQVEQANKDEAKGNNDVITNKAYHQTLSNFINRLVDESYDFTAPLEQASIQLSQSIISNISFEADEHTSFDSKIMFFTQAADNDYFIVKNSFDIEFLKVAEVEGEADKVLRLEDLSDGEYQLLFLYSLIDLFDKEDTLFLFDEADSHLHYKNIDNLWSVFKIIKGMAITTTHLLDSISKSGIERLKVIDRGEIKTGAKISYLASRLKDLSDLNNAQLKVMSIAENIVFMDDEDDWVIFKLLAIRKLAKTLDEVATMNRFFSRFIVIKQESSYGSNSEEFGYSKLRYSERFASYIEGHHHNTENVYLICDRDEFLLTDIGNEKCILLISKDSTKTFNNKKLSSHLLSWRRREIKHYLMCPSALTDNNIEELNEAFNLGLRSKLVKGHAGDYSTDGEYNSSLASVKADLVKGIIDSYIKDDVGFCAKRTEDFIKKIPLEEISEDIVKLYQYLEATSGKK